MGTVALLSGSYDSFFVLMPSLLIFLFSFYFSSFSTSFIALCYKPEVAGSISNEVVGFFN
jgi:hypothetical protein